MKLVSSITPWWPLKWVSYVESRFCLGTQDCVVFSIKIFAIHWAGQLLGCRWHIELRQDGGRARGAASKISFHTGHRTFFGNPPTAGLKVAAMVSSEWQADWLRSEDGRLRRKICSVTVRTKNCWSELFKFKIWVFKNLGFQINF